MNQQQMVHVGLEVRTSDGKRLGKVKEVGSGTFEVEKGLFYKHDVSLSYEDIDQVVGGIAVLRLSAADLS